MFGLKARCHTRFQRAFTTRYCVFKEITLIASNQRHYFENANECSKRTLKTLVATRLYVSSSSSCDIRLEIGFKLVISHVKRTTNNFSQIIITILTSKTFLVFVTTEKNLTELEPLNKISFFFATHGIKRVCRSKAREH